MYMYISGERLKEKIEVDHSSERVRVHVHHNLVESFYTCMYLHCICTCNFFYKYSVSYPFIFSSELQVM